MHLTSSSVFRLRKRTNCIAEEGPTARLRRFFPPPVMDIESQRATAEEVQSLNIRGSLLDVGRMAESGKQETVTRRGSWMRLDAVGMFRFRYFFPERRQPAAIRSTAR